MVGVRVSCCTVCGSDVHAWTGRRPPSFLPAIIGHEICGVVNAVGEEPPPDFEGELLDEGDRVTFSLTASCGICYYCSQAGLPQKCEALVKYGHRTCDADPALTGGLAEYVYLFPGTSIFRVPSGVTDEVAATAMCAGATMAHALEGAREAGYRSVVLVGAGMLGLWGIRLALDEGFETVVCCDVDGTRLRTALEAGATEIVDVGATKGEDGVSRIRSATGGRGADLCVDLSGSPEGIRLGLSALRVGGTLKLVGSVVPVDDGLCDPFEIVTRSLTVHGIHNYRPEHLASALSLAQDPSHHAAISGGIGRSFDLDAADEAFRAAHAREALRVAVRMHGR